MIFVKYELRATDTMLAGVTRVVFQLLARRARQVRGPFERAVPSAAYRSNKARIQFGGANVCMCRRAAGKCKRVGS